MYIYTEEVLALSCYLLINPPEFRDLLQPDENNSFIKRKGAKIPLKYMKEYIRMRIYSFNVYIRYKSKFRYLFYIFYFCIFPIRWMIDIILIYWYRHLFRKYQGKKYQDCSLFSWSVGVSFEDKDLKN